MMDNLENGMLGCSQKQHAESIGYLVGDTFTREKEFFADVCQRVLYDHVNRFQGSFSDFVTIPKDIEENGLLVIPFTPEEVDVTMFGLWLSVSKFYLDRFDTIASPRIMFRNTQGNKLLLYGTTAHPFYIQVETNRILVAYHPLARSIALLNKITNGEVAQ